MQLTRRPGKGPARAAERPAYFADVAAGAASAAAAAGGGAIGIDAWSMMYTQRPSLR